MHVGWTHSSRAAWKKRTVGEEVELALLEVGPDVAEAGRLQVEEVPELGAEVGVAARDDAQPVARRARDDGCGGERAQAVAHA
jgi:hypothetical protein